MTDRTLPQSSAVFPLPNCVLFPKVLLPLRIFEPRYKAMMRDVIDTHGWIAIALRPEERPPRVPNRIGISGGTRTGSPS